MEMAGKVVTSLFIHTHTHNVRFDFQKKFREFKSKYVQRLCANVIILQTLGEQERHAIKLFFSRNYKRLFA